VTPFFTWPPLPSPDGMLMSEKVHGGTRGQEVAASVEHDDEQLTDEASRVRRERAFAAYVAALAVASEVDLPAVLQRIVDLAREVVPAKYAALGVAENGRIVEFITSGITQEQRAAIGPPPQGHGLLKVLIEKGEPLLVPDISADPRSHGFPPNHPVMKSLIGVPIKLGQRTLGDLYLTERLDGRPFDEQDLEVLTILASHAAAAIDRAYLYRELAASRTQAEEQRDQVRAILDSLPSGVLIHVPPDGKVELANDAAIQMLLGPALPASTMPVPDRHYTLLQADGTSLPSDERPGMRALRGESIRNRQLLVERWDGHRFPVLVQANPLRDARSQIVRAVVVIQDITRLREAEQLKDDFISLVSHELRTPVTTIYGGAHLLAHEGETLDEGTRASILADIVAESERLEQMLSNLLSLASIQAGRLEPNTEPVLIKPLAKRVAAEVQNRTIRHTFTVEIPTDLPPVEADPNLLSQVLRNLLENAVKYSPDGGEICVSASLEAPLVAIHVTDQGVGIAPEHVNQVFERFRRPGAPPTVRGMGLGLYLSRHLVEAQRGTISATSAGPGQGATFTIRLPIARDWEEE